MSYYNPFQNIEIGVSKKYKSEIDNYCQTQPLGGKAPSPVNSPFSRMIDMWFFAFCLGIKEGKKREIDNFDKIITGEILSRDAERIHLIEAALIAETNNPQIIANPREMIKLANEYANYGVPLLIDMLTSGHSKPIWNLSDSLLS